MLHQDELFNCLQATKHNWFPKTGARATILNFCLRRWPGSSVSALCLCLHALTMCVRVHTCTHTHTLSSFPHVKQPSGWFRLSLASEWGINAKADLVLSAPSVSLWNWPFILVPCFSFLFFSERVCGQSKFLLTFIVQNATCEAFSRAQRLFFSRNRPHLFLKFNPTLNNPVPAPKTRDSLSVPTNWNLIIAFLRCLL